MRLFVVAVVLGTIFLAAASENVADDLDQIEKQEEFPNEDNELDEPTEDPDAQDEGLKDNKELEPVDNAEDVDDEGSMEGANFEADSDPSEIEQELEGTSAEKDPKPFWRRRSRRRRRWVRRRRSRRRRSRRRRSRRRRSRRRRSRRRRRIFGGIRNIFRKRFWKRKFFPSCRRSSFRAGRRPLTTSTAPRNCINSNNLNYQARCWAPKIYMAIGEGYRPSSVDFFFNYVKLVRKSGRRLYVVNNQPRAYNLVAGNSNYFLKSKYRIRKPSSTVWFFRGQSPRHVPIYTMWRQFRRGGKVVRDFIYWAFYPYNRGKNVCIGGVAGSRCFGGCTVMGNHVGDWEHVTVRLVNNRPSKMFISAHNFGGTYSWNGRTFVKGNDRVTFSRDGHPIVYSALGSHGLWTRRGRMTYKKIKNGEKLQDLVSSGTPWDTWRNIKLIHYVKNKRYGGYLKWMNFRGRWGDPKRGCAILEKISGECRLNSGPTGPSAKSVMTSTNLS